MKQLPADGLHGICIALDFPIAKADYRSKRHVGAVSVASPHLLLHCINISSVHIHGTTTGTLET